jgi:hypothetical protein
LVIQLGGRIVPAELLRGSSLVDLSPKHQKCYSPQDGAIEQDRDRPWQTLSHFHNFQEMKNRGEKSRDTGPDFRSKSFQYNKMCNGNRYGNLGADGII